MNRPEPVIDFEREVTAAHERISPWIVRTPLVELRTPGDARVHAKLENLQHTGSFKLRGALNKLLLAQDAGGLGGVVAASTGNHGAAVAWAARELGVAALVFAPHGASAAKLEVVRALGAEVRFEGNDCVEAERAARAHAREREETYVSPYNDPDVIAGQGTIGRELTDKLAAPDAVFVSVGGGGLAAGLAGWLAARSPTTAVHGISPRRSPALHAALAAGRIVDVACETTLSDATAGGLEEGALTFGLCRDLLADSTLVGEDEIAAAMRLAGRELGRPVEGAAGAALAGLLRDEERYAGRDVVVVICGGNIAPTTWRSVTG